MASATPPSPAQQLLVTGLCGECISVEWRHDYTVCRVKDMVYTAASDALLADRTRHSFVQGINLDQLSLVHEVHGHSKKLEDDRALLASLREIYRSEIIAFAYPYDMRNVFGLTFTQRG